MIAGGIEVEILARVNDGEPIRIGTITVPLKMRTEENVIHVEAAADAAIAARTLGRRIARALEAV